MSDRTARELAEWLGESEAVVRRMTVKELADATIRRIDAKNPKRRPIDLSEIVNRRLPTGDR